MSTTTISPRGRVSRLAYATMAALLLAGIATDAITHSSYWQIAAFGVTLDAPCGAADRHPRALGSAQPTEATSSR